MTQIAIISSEPIRARMAGAAIRATELARALHRRGLEVSLHAPPAPINEPSLADQEITSLLQSLDLRRASVGHDVIIIQGHLTQALIDSGYSGRLIVDLYDPNLIENASYASELGPGLFERNLREWQQSLAEADLLLCAGEQQRSYYLGMLTALGHVGAAELARDPDLRDRMDCVPFGLPEQLPPHQPYLPPREPGKPRILFGGIYDWYDPLTLLHALDCAELENLQVLFVRNTNPDSTPQRLFAEVQRWCSDQGWGANRVDFIDWVPAKRRFDLLRDVDLLAAPHPASLETRLSMRTRFLEAMACACPVIASSGGEIDALVRRYGSGAVVAPGDVMALRAALVDWLPAGQQRRDLASAAARFRTDLSWHKVVQPIIDFCQRTAGTESHPEVSVLLATYNRMDILPEVLDALEAQRDAPAFELVIVDDGSCDGTCRWLEQRPFKFSTQVIHQDNLGPAAARNRAVQAARGEYIAFLGDDMRPAPDWLRQHLHAHEQRDNAAGLIVVGKTEWHQRIRRTPFLRHIDASGWQFGFDDIEDPENLPFNYLYGSNLSLRRQQLLDQPYHEGFPYPAWEDIELGHRLVKQGCRLVFAEQALAYHDHPTDIRRFSQRQERAGYSGALFGKLHPELSHMTWPTEQAMRESRSARTTAVLTRLAANLQRLPLRLPRIWDRVLTAHYAAGARRFLRDQGIATDDFSALGARYDYPLRYAADSEQLKHNTGALTVDGWLCRTDTDAPGHFVFGQDLRLSTDEELEARFHFEPNPGAPADASAVNLDVYDQRSDSILHAVSVNYGELNDAPYLRLPFNGRRGQVVELRGYWFGAADLTFVGLELCEAGAPARAFETKSEPAPTDDSPFTPVEQSDARFRNEKRGWTIQADANGRMAMYLRIEPRQACELSPGFDITAHYQDRGTGEFWLEYIDTDSGTWRRCETMRLGNSGEPRQASFHLGKARLTGGHNGADLRILVSAQDTRELTLHQLKLSLPEQAAAEPGVLDERFVYPADTSPIDLRGSDEPQVSIVIPVFNKLDYTLQCLRAIQEFTPPIYAVILVDNGSSDGSAEALREIPGLRLQINDSNLGFARACNQGGRLAKTPWVVFLNNDTLPQPGWLTSLVACAERRPGIGMVGCKLVMPQNGRVQAAGAGFGRYLLPVELHKNKTVDDPAVSHDRDVQALVGACLLLSREHFERYQGFDEGYLNGLEDVDLCLRMHRDGLRLVYCANSEVLHYVSVTQGRLDAAANDRNVKLFRERWLRYLIALNPNPGQPRLHPGALPYGYDATASGLQSGTGSRGQGEIHCLPGEDTPGHCAYGPPLLFLQPMPLLARFLISVDGTSADIDRPLLTVDAYDTASDQVLATRELRTDDLQRADTALAVAVTPAQIVEFRVFWHARSTLRFSGVELSCVDGDSPEAHGLSMHGMTEKDRAEVRALFQTCFDTPIPEALWDWKYAQGRGVSVLARREGELVAHYGGVLRNALDRGRAVSALQSCDMMVAPAERGRLARKGAYYWMTHRFLYLHSGYGKAGELSYGFPNSRNLRLGNMLGLTESVDEIVELHWQPLPDTSSTALPYDPDDPRQRDIASDLWQAMARDFREDILVVRNPDYLDYRYIKHPLQHYELHFVRHPSREHSLGLIVTKTEGDALILCDLLGRRADFPVLVDQARHLAHAHGSITLSTWVTESHMKDLDTGSPRIEHPEVTVPCNVLTPAPTAESIRGRWWLMTGDTDFK